MTPLPSQTFTYAYWLNTMNPETRLPVPGLGSHRFSIFHRPARLLAMELKRAVGDVGGRPDQVVIEGYDDPDSAGKILFQGSLPWGDSDVCRLEFPDVPLLAVSQRCHWRRDFVEQFMEWHPTRYTVPFNIFDGTSWHGETDTTLRQIEPPAPPVMTRGRIAPASGDGVTATSDGMFVHFSSDSFRISFSLVRPRISFLSWDGLGTGRIEKNFIVDSAQCFEDSPASGPWRRSLAYQLPPMLWTGSVEVSGRRVSYRDLRSLDGFSMDVDFDLDANGFAMHIRQRSDADRLFLDAEAWRFVWDGHHVYSLATLARPQRGAHRNGIVEPIGAWHSTGQGSLSFRPIDSAPVGMQIDTSGFGGRRLAFGGLLVGVRPEPFGPVTLLKGQHQSSMRFEVTNLEPDLSAAPSRESVHPGVRRAWGSIFAFRPEHGGYSNNSFGVSCENCSYLVADMAPYTRTRAPLPSMTELLRYTAELHLKGGPGYACFLEEAHDTAPSQLISAGRIFQTERNADWVRKLWPFIERPIRHILDNRDASGFYVCHRLSGNSRSFRTSSNAIDTFCFGYADGYAGALAYRGLKNAIALARVAEKNDLAKQCADAAEQLRAAFVPTLMNPETGWLAAWRSADGALHDYAFLIINAMAIVYGILDEKLSREVIRRLEAKRLAVGIDDFRYGLPPSLDPVAARDQCAEGGWTRKDIPHRADGADTFGIFINGGLTPCSAGLYLAALSRFGWTDVADRMCDQLLESFDAGVFEGSLNGAEAYTLDGLRSGYEGTLAHCYQVLLAIGQHKGWIKPMTPQWWPQEAEG